MLIHTKLNTQLRRDHACNGKFVLLDVVVELKSFIVVLTISRRQPIAGRSGSLLKTARAERFVRPSALPGRQRCDFLMCVPVLYLLELGG